MHRVVEYTLIFLVLVLLQVFLFDNLNLSPYLYPLVYVGFIILLPVGLHPAWTLLLGFLVGAVTDLLSGTPGLNTIASTATAFCRPALLNLTIGKDALQEIILPLPLQTGRAKWMKYAGAAILLHCMLSFFFEAASFRYAGFTLLRIAGSATTTFLLIWFLAGLLPARMGK